MQYITSENAPQAIGPYSQAIELNGLIYCTGQIPLTPLGELVCGDINEQTRQVFDNLSAVLHEVGSSLQKVVKATIFLQDIGVFTTVNTLCAEYFGDHKPARTTVEVSNLPLNAAIAIDVIAGK
jgi:2-iminobutanoate/2-iminopropanoate deaminase